ncbi:helix-turn-helix domain-containing protein [Nonomuraea sp. NPDC049784]|uniref:ArsR/SmtB family transcription factor n=1 Tax=Nonomuraea sp. NPDC049784 TaxID=3154361 RepID=UPI0033C77E1C
MGDVFKALSDPTRRTILDELTDRNGQTLFEICARLTTKHGLGSSRQAISQHLDVLEAAGLVETSREGRETPGRKGCRPRSKCPEMPPGAMPYQVPTSNHRADGLPRPLLLCL